MFILNSFDILFKLLMNKVLNQLYLKINNVGVFYKFFYKYINNFVMYKLNEIK